MEKGVGVFYVSYFMRGYVRVVLWTFGVSHVRERCFFVGVWVFVLAPLPVCLFVCLFDCVLVCLFVCLLVCLLACLYGV